jgi:hypothetical protein
MSKIYQPLVLDRADEIMGVLEETHFFEDYEIEDTTYAMEYLCDMLTQKFILGELTEDEPMFTDDEMDKCLREIVAGSYLSELQKDGIIDSIEGEDNEERFFLTDFGKKIAEEVQKQDKKSKKGKKST